MKYEKQFGNIVLKETDNYKWGVEDLNGNIIVPYGKYAWIDGFENGLARVRTEKKNKVSNLKVYGVKTNSNNEDNNEHSEKWGLIDETGKEVLPLEYGEIWNFKGKGRNTTRVVKDGVDYDFNLNTRTLSAHHDIYVERCDFDDDYGHHYGEFAGSYAQDVMGYSDDVINDAFEGDPDAYWNID